MIRIIFALLSMFLAGAAVSDEPSINMDKWLYMSLYGNDNDAASLRKVTIKDNGGTYTINIANQFNFECNLDFSKNGDPATLSDCKSKDKPTPVCNPDAPDSQCAVSKGCFQKPNEKNPACFSSWLVKEQSVSLVCSSTKTERVCKGKYTLGTTEGFVSDGEFTIARKRN